MKLNSNNPAMSTATGTQKSTSVSTLLSRDVGFGFSELSMCRYATVLIVFAFGVGGGLFAFVGFPGLRDNVSVNGVGLLNGEARVGKSKFRRVGKARHALRPMGAAHHDLIPILVDFERGVTKIGHSAVFHPGSAAIDAGRLAAFAVKRDVKFFALLNCFQGGLLLGRFRNRWNFNLRSREWNAAAKLEGVEALRAALRFGRSHGAG